MKDEIALEAQKEKKQVNPTLRFFSCGNYENDECWIKIEQATLESSKLPTIRSKRNAIKQQIIVHVKGFGFSEQHTAWSSHGIVHSVEHLQQHLFHVVTDRMQTGKKLTKPSMQAPKKKDLPVLDVQSNHVREKLEEDSQHQKDLEHRSIELRSQLKNEGKLDEMSKLQHVASPALKRDDRTQCAFRCIDEDEDNKEIMEWSVGTALEVSTGDNHYLGCRLHRKDRAVEDEWDVHEANDADVSTSIVEIKKSLFNAYVKDPWRLLFDVEWSNKPLQDAWDAKENRNESELT